MINHFTQHITSLVVLIVVVFFYYYSIMQTVQPTFPHFPVKTPKATPCNFSYYPCRLAFNLVGGHLGRLQKVVKVLAAELLDSAHPLILCQWQIRE